MIQFKQLMQLAGIWAASISTWVMSLSGVNNLITILVGLATLLLTLLKIIQLLRGWNSNYKNRKKL